MGISQQKVVKHPMSKIHNKGVIIVPKKRASYKKKLLLKSIFVSYAGITRFRYNGYFSAN